MNKKMLWCMVAFAAMFSACDGESPLAQHENALDEFEYEQSKSNYAGISSEYYAGRSSEYYRSSSSSATIIKNALEKCVESYNPTCCNTCYSKLMSYECKYCTDKCYDDYGNNLCNSTSVIKSFNFTLTHYKQMSKGWDGGSKYTDGDPMISFKIKFINASGIEIESVDTGKLLSLENEGLWNGRKSFTHTVPVLTETISVCPSVFDEDIKFHDDYSSGYCYSYSTVGTLEDRKTVKQRDSYSNDYELEWEWVIF